MNKAKEFHNLADYAKNCNEEIQKILSACRKMPLLVTIIVVFQKQD